MSLPARCRVCIAREAGAKPFVWNRYESTSVCIEYDNLSAEKVYLAKWMRGRRAMASNAIESYSHVPTNQSEMNGWAIEPFYCGNSGAVEYSSPTLSKPIHNPATAVWRNACSFAGLLLISKGEVGENQSKKPITTRRKALRFRYRPDILIPAKRETSFEIDSKETSTFEIFPRMPNNQLQLQKSIARNSMMLKKQALRKILCKNNVKIKIWRNEKKNSSNTCQRNIISLRKYVKETSDMPYLGCAKAPGGGRYLPWNLQSTFSFSWLENESQENL